LVKKESEANGTSALLKRAQQSREEALKKASDACLEIDELRFKLREVQFQLGRERTK
jgi:hypothetical protein